MDVAAQARLALAAQAREAADRLHDLVGVTAAKLPPGGRTTMVRDVRQATMHALDLAVLADLADGATWHDIAEALRLPVDLVAERYGDALPSWRTALADPTPHGAANEHDLGLIADPDPAGTAASLDQWWQRHADPWAAIDDAPVSRALAGT